MDAAKGFLIEIVGSVLARFMVSTERTHWLYLLATVLLVAVIWWWQRRQPTTIADQRGVGGFFRFIFPGAVWKHPSAKTDYRYFLVNSILMLAILFPVSVAAAGWLQDLAALILAPLTPVGAGRAAVAWPWLLFATLVSLTTMDATIFLCHTAMHRIGVLWEFHKVHHSAKVLVPFTLYRMHPVELVFTALAAAFTMAMTSGLLSLLQGSSVAISSGQIMGVNGFLFVFYVLGYNLRHSHIWLAYPVWLSHMLISPAQHQIHHSCEDRHLDKNMGLVFALWDWAAGSLYVPKERESFDLGLSDGEDAEFAGVLALYFLPFKKSWRRLMAGSR